MIRIAGRDGGTDRRREQHRHPLGLALVPDRNQLIGILKDLLFGGAPAQPLLALPPCGAGLSRKRDGIYLLLVEIYSVARDWLERGQAEKIKLALIQLRQSHIDRRLIRNSFRFLVEQTCPTVNKTVRSRYANALRYASAHHCPSSRLPEFIKSRGGIEECDRRFRALRRRKAASMAQESHLKRRMTW
jgi:hypothetical protein